MRAAVDMQQLPEAGARLAAAAVPTPRAALGEQAGGLQEPFDERVAERDPMVALGELMKVGRIKPGVLLLVEARDARDLRHGGAAGRGLVPPAIPEPVIAALLIPQPPAAQGAGPPAQDILRLQPGQLSTDGLHQHFLHLHRSLHDGRGIGHVGPPGPPCPAPRRPLERSIHVLLTADISCATYIRGTSRLTAAMCRLSIPLS